MFVFVYVFVCSFVKLCFVQVTALAFGIGSWASAIRYCVSVLGNSVSAVSQTNLLASVTVLGMQCQLLHSGTELVKITTINVI